VRIELWILIFAVIYAFLHIMPALLTDSIRYMFTVGDLLDLFTPLVMIFLIYKLYRLLVHDKDKMIKQKSILAEVVLITGSVLFLEGHGIHLSANAIFRHIIEQEGADIYKLTYFLDETLSHILWDCGLILISIGLMMLAARVPLKKYKDVKQFVIISAAVFFGFTFYVDAVEGQTVVFTFPASIIIPVLIFLVCRKHNISIRKNPLLNFYLFGYIVSLVLFIVWLIWQGGFPQFSDIGWIE
jgi:hypothetical protein